MYIFITYNITINTRVVTNIYKEIRSHYYHTIECHQKSNKVIIIKQQTIMR